MVAAGRTTLEDLGSKNGTRLNGIRIGGPVAIEDGDEIEIGGVKVIFRVSASDDSVTPVAAKLASD